MASWIRENKQEHEMGITDVLDSKMLELQIDIKPCGVVAMIRCL
jgi:hypothetical protein